MKKLVSARSHVRAFALSCISFVTLYINPPHSWASKTEIETLDRIQQRLHEGDLAYYPENNLLGEEIGYSIWNPKGQETFILIHGLGGSRGTWSGVFGQAGVAEELAKTHRVIAIDQRGHGETPCRGLSFSSTTLATDVKVLMDHLGIKQAYLVGHSMGGRTAIRFGHMFPERSKGIVVEDMHALGRRTLLENGSSWFRAQMKIRDDLAKAAIENPEADLPSYKIPARPSSTSLYSNQGLQEDLTLAIREQKNPILFLKAEYGPVLWGKGVDHIYDHNPNAHVFEVRGTGHGIHNMAKDTYVDLLRIFAGPPNSLTPGQFNLETFNQAPRHARHKLRIPERGETQHRQAHDPTLDQTGDGSQTLPCADLIRTPRPKPTFLSYFFD